MVQGSAVVCVERVCVRLCAKRERARSKTILLRKRLSYGPRSASTMSKGIKGGGGERKTACKTGFDDGEYFLVLFCEKKLFFFLCVSTKH